VHHEILLKLLILKSISCVYTWRVCRYGVSSHVPLGGRSHGTCEKPIKCHISHLNRKSGDLPYDSHVSGPKAGYRITPHNPFMTGRKGTL
jgi:hypothetical protein